MKVHLSDHAVERYIARVKPTLGPDEARGELRRLLEFAPAPQVERPWSIPPEHEHNQADAFLTISDGICQVLMRSGREGYVAASCITRAGLSDEGRRAVNRAKSRRRRAKRIKNRSHYRSDKVARFE